MTRTGRNDPCVCGSGKKFKHCCLGKEGPTNYRFSKYSSGEFLKILALLLVLPNNHGKNIRIEQAILDALRHINTNKLKFDLSQLRNDLLTYYTPQPYEDPPEEFFTELLYWPKGNNLVFPGVPVDGVGIVQHLLNTITTSRKLPAGFVGETEPVITLLFSIHSRIALTLGYTARLFEDEHGEALFIPDDSFIQNHKGLFSFPVEVMTKMANKFEVSLELFHRFVFDLDKRKLDFDDPNNSPIFQQPFVLIEEEYILVDPTAQLFCLNDFILETARKYGCYDVLLSAYHENTAIELFPVFYRMGWQEINFNFPNDDSFPRNSIWKELLYSIDTNRLVYAVISTEIPSVETVLEKSIANFSNELQNRAKKMAGLIKAAFPDHLLLFVYVTNKTRILSKVVLQLSRLKYIDYDLFFSHEELFLLTRKWKPDRLALWKYARCLNEFENQHKFPPYNTHYSKMKWYFDHEESFYHSDKKMPSILVFEFEIESEVRRSAIELLDKKAVPYWDGQRATFIPCYRKEEYYPVYISQDINRGLLASCLSKYDCPIWCVSSRKNDFQGDVYINGILYWLHEMFDYTKEWMKPLGSIPLLLKVTLEEGLYSLGGELVLNEPEEVLFRSKIDAENRRIDLLIPNTLRSYLYSAGNRGEWLLMNFIIDMIGDLQQQLKVGTRLTDEFKTTLFKAIMPDGPKKFINTLTDYRDLTLTPTDIDEPRTVPKADISYVLQNQMAGLNKPVLISKIIIKQEQTKLLNELVSYHYQKIKNAVVEYDGLTLLQLLMRRQESILQDNAFRKVNYPVKQACYGRYHNVFEEYYTTAKLQNVANLALRVLIEWVACWMPTGKIKCSNDDTDMILAHVCQVINYGTLSDEIKYGLREVELELLPSGRLGFDRQKNKASFDAMADKIFESEYHELGERFYEYYQYGGDKERNKQRTKYAEKIDEVFKKEWGISIYDIFGLTYELVHTLFGKGQSVTLISKKELFEMIGVLKYTVGEIEGWLKILQFIKRDNVLIQPAGYKPEEVYPWRYNRRISYLLKPLIVIEQNGIEHILISTRHLYKAAENLVSLFNDGRLPLDKESKPIRSLLAERNALKGNEYREEILQWLKTKTGLFAYPQEITIKRKGFFVADEDKGDIDIMAIDHEQKIVYSIECKNTSQSKLAYEFHLEIIDYLGHQGRPGLIQKHVNRDLWLKENREQVFKKLIIDSEYKLFSIVISNHVLPTAFLRTTPLPVISFYELKQFGLPTKLHP